MLYIYKFIFIIQQEFIDLLSYTRLMAIYLFLIYFIDYAITVVPIFPLLSPLHLVLLFPLAIPHHSSCPWVMYISSLASPFPIVFLTSSILYLPLMLLIPCTFFSILSFPPPLLITLHVISISVVLFLFQLFAQFVFVFLGSVVDSSEFVVILLFIGLYLFLR